MTRRRDDAPLVLPREAPALVEVQRQLVQGEYLFA